jgi:hypothetical protein
MADATIRHRDLARRFDRRWCVAARDSTSLLGSDEVDDRGLRMEIKLLSKAAAAMRKLPVGQISDFLSSPSHKNIPLNTSGKSVL